MYQQLNEQFCECEGISLSNLLQLTPYCVSEKCIINISVIFQDILASYNKNKCSLELVKCDTGQIIMVFNDIVVKIYPIEKYQLIQEILNLKSSNIEPVLKLIILDQTIIIVNTKIIPILVNNGFTFKLNTVLDSSILIRDIPIILIFDEPLTNNILRD
jgi:hypothetical protein